jgi:hypothetical protein
VTTCKDKKIRVFDVRAGNVVAEMPGHQGVKGTRVEWMGPLDKFVTTVSFQSLHLSPFHFCPFDSILKKIIFVICTGLLTVQ